VLESRDGPWYMDSGNGLSASSVACSGVCAAASVRYAKSGLPPAVVWLMAPITWSVHRSSPHPLSAPVSGTVPAVSSCQRSYMSGTPGILPGSPFAVRHSPSLHMD